MSLDEIAEVFNVTADEIRAVLQFTAGSLAKEPHARQIGWHELENGELLAKAEAAGY